MQDFGLGRIDKIIMAVSFIGVFGFAYLLVNDSLVIQHVSQSRSQLKPVGVIESARNDVRRRMGQSLVWYDISDEDTVYDRDSVFTGDESEITVRLRDESTLELGSNSLVVIQGSAQELTLDLQLGSVLAKVSKGKSLKIAHQGQVTSVRGGSQQGKGKGLSITKSKSGSIEFASASGGSEVEINGQIQSIGTDQVLSISSELKVEKRTLAVQLLSPANNQPVWLDSSKDTIEFSWKSSLPEAVAFELAADRSFKKVIKSIENKNGSQKVRGLILNKAYYWRVQGLAESKDVTSKVHRVKVIKNAAPTPVLPSPGLKLVLNEEELSGETGGWPVTFRWKPVPTVKQYLVQVAQDDSFRKLNFSEDSANIRRHRAHLKPGIYFWRVRTNGGTPADSSWSKSISFSLERETPPSPQKQPTQVTKIPGDGPPTDATDVKPYLESKPVEHSQALGPKAPEVREESKAIAPTAPIPLELNKKSTLVYAESADPTSTKNLQKNIKRSPVLSWGKVDSAKSYEIQIANEKKFKKPIVEQKILNPKFRWKSSVPGNYFWRVRSLDSDKQMSPYSEPAQVQVLVLPPQLKKDIAAKMSVRKPADLTSVKEPVEVSWPAVAHADHYKVAVGSKAKFKTPLMELETKDPGVSVPLAKGGQYFVKVAAFNRAGERISQYSRPSKITYEKSLSLNPPTTKMPGNGITLVSFKTDQIDPILFSWNRVPHAKNYQLQFAKDENFSEILNQIDVNRQQFILKKQLHNGIVYWRVRASYDQFNSNWSEPRWFETQSVKSK